jgi:drug/metabolite transporter (DMT)-like permease
MPRTVLLGAAMCLVAVVSWGGMFHIMEHALALMDPFYITAIRYLIASLIFLGILAWAEGTKSLRLEGRGLSLWLLGTAGFAGFGFLVFLGQQAISGPEGAVSAAIVLATMPLMTAFVHWALSGKRPAAYTFASCFVALAGVLLVVTHGHITQVGALGGHILADAEIVAGGLCWVVYTVGGSRFPDWSPLRYTALSCILGTLSVLGITLAATASDYITAPSPAAVLRIGWDMTYMVAIAGILAVFSWNRGNRTLGPVNGSLFLNMVPVTTLGLSFASGESVAPSALYGSIMVIGALVMNNLFQRYGGPR